MLPAPPNKACEEEMLSAVAESADMMVHDVRSQAQLVGRALVSNEEEVFGPDQLKDGGAVGLLQERSLESEKENTPIISPGVEKAENSSISSERKPDFT